MPAPPVQAAVEAALRRRSTSQDKNARTALAAIRAFFALRVSLHCGRFCVASRFALGTARVAEGQQGAGCRTRGIRRGKPLTVSPLLTVDRPDRYFPVFSCQFFAQTCDIASQKIRVAGKVAATGVGSGICPQDVGAASAKGDALPYQQSHHACQQTQSPPANGFCILHCRTWYGMQATHTRAIRALQRHLVHPVQYLGCRGGGVDRLHRSHES